MWTKTTKNRRVFLFVPPRCIALEYCSNPAHVEITSLNKRSEKWRIRPSMAGLGLQYSTTVSDEARA